MWLNGFNESMNDRCINSSLFDHRMLWINAKIKWRAITHYFNIFTYLFSSCFCTTDSHYLTFCRKNCPAWQEHLQIKTHTHSHNSNDWSRLGYIKHILPFGHIMLFSLFDIQWRHDFSTNHSSSSFFFFLILFLFVFITHRQLLSNRKSIGTKIKPAKL